MQYRLSNTRFETVRATLIAYKQGVINKQMTDILMRYALFNTPDLLNKYIKLLEEDDMTNIVTHTDEVELILLLWNICAFQPIC